MVDLNKGNTGGNKVLGFVKRRWKYILTALIALIIGANTGPSGADLDKVNSKVKAANAKNAEMKDEIGSNKAKINRLTKDNKELSNKVSEAAPFFAMSEQERENQEKEAQIKAAELKKQEEAKKEAAAQALAEKTKTFGAGKYVVGRDIDAGLYDCKAVSGQGNFIVDDGGKVNEMFGVGDSEWYNPEFNNLELEDGDTIDINNDLHIKFIPKE